MWPSLDQRRLKTRHDFKSEGNFWLTWFTTTTGMLYVLLSWSNWPPNKLSCFARLTRSTSTWSGRKTAAKESMMISFTLPDFRRNGTLCSRQRHRSSWKNVRYDSSSSSFTDKMYLYVRMHVCIYESMYVCIYVTLWIHLWMHVYLRMFVWIL